MLISNIEQNAENPKLLGRSQPLFALQRIKRRFRTRQPSSVCADLADSESCYTRSPSYTSLLFRMLDEMSTCWIFRPFVNWRTYVSSSGKLEQA